MANSQTFTLNIKAVADMKDVQSNIQNIQSALSKLKLPDNLKASFKTTFSNLDKEITKYQNLLANGIKTKTDANALEKSGNTIVRLYDDIVKKINSLDNSALKKAFEDMGEKEVQKLRNQLTGLENDLKTKLSNQKLIDFTSTKAELKSLTTQFQNEAGEISAAFKTISNSTINSLFHNIDIGRLDLAEKNLEKIEAKAKELNNIDLNNWVQKLRNGFEQLKNNSEISDTTQKIQQLKQELTTVKAETIAKLIQQFNQGKVTADQFEKELVDLTTQTTNWGQAQAQTNKELDQVKSRIQYFFGLNNAINLVKRAIRGAVDTIKELDKAMTETAVVTDFTVSDMWEQLPEYTKRANELGVTTKAAYEAATLYYQQGLNTKEVTALSVETLKMARIAGLEAAEATDRMTNALRGFNMELNETNAQRVDDVYSRLAAISASNVDEISTAMTKVASLAHNAGMEFETTAAFLAQIIETTRESAETAGTALKTVIARFAEVKKLVDEDELTGTDDEGEVIDVNKVSEALRSAGIDLNKYFLGEVGIDDIFMELASKWDSLTSLQQRYIATQAAGSRQQSRFIALMSDYARTTELVGEAYNANGASAKQFAKTQESLESKLARLKNAWNEFLMGLTNSTVVKLGVDLLTDLLNLVNKLTSAFGEGTGSILKWVAAISTLRGASAFFRTGGGFDALFKGSFGSNIANRILGNAGTGAGGRHLANGANGAAQTSIISTLGKGLWSGAQGLGNKLFGIGGAAGTQALASGSLIAGTQGLAAGLAGVGAALGVVAAAATAVYTIYSAWLRLTPQGQIKLAEKHAKALNSVADAAQKNADEYKDAISSIEQYNKAVDEASTVSAHDTAIKDRNEYISSLIEQNAEYARYVKYVKEDGDFVLKVDEESLKAAADAAAKSAAQAAANAYIGNAQVYNKQADYYRGKLSNVDLENRTIKESGTDGENGNVTWTRALSDEEFSLYTSYAQKAEEAIAQMEAEAAAGFLKLLDSSTIPDSIANTMSQLLAKGIDETEVADPGALWWTHGEQYYLDKYEEITHQKLNASDVSWREAAEAYAQALQTSELQVRVNNLSDIVTASTNEDALEKALNTYLNQEDYTNKNLSLFDVRDENAIATQLFGYEDVEEAATDLVKIADYLGISIDELVNTLQKNIKQQREYQTKTVNRTAADIYAMGATSGVSDNTMVDFLRQFYELESFDTQMAVADLFAAVSSTDLAGPLIENLSSAFSGGKLDEDVAAWIGKIDFSNPISGFAALQDAADSTNQAIASIATSILNDEQAMKQFSASNQLSAFLMSDAYEDVTDELDKFIEENGKISSTNIRKLADENKSLNQLLNNGKISAKALATALNGIQTGTVKMEDLNDAIIAALNSMDDLDGIVKDTIDDLNDFDPGFDENDITDFITTAYENAQENIEKGAYGNNVMHSYMQKIFGDFEYTGSDEGYGDAYIDWLNRNMGWLEQNKENMYSAWTDFSNGLSNKQLELRDTVSGELLKTAEVFEQGGEIIIKSNGMTTQELIDAMIQNSNLTETQARMMIADFKNYSADFAHEMAQNDLGTSIAAWAESARTAADGTIIYTDKELKTLANLLGVSVDDIKNKITELSTELDEETGEAKYKFENALEIDTSSANAFKKSLADLGYQVTDTEEALKALAETDIQTDEIIDVNGLATACDNLQLDFEETLNTLVGDAQEYTALINGTAETISVEAGETAAQAYNRTVEQIKQADFAEAIGTAVSNALKEDGYDVKFIVNKDEVTGDITTIETEVNSLAGDYPIDFPINTEAAVAQVHNLRDAMYELAEATNAVATANNNAASSGSDGSSAPGANTHALGGGASGGYVPSYATGTDNLGGLHKLTPGPALTGEEGPEIIWNKNKGYAYITGAQHPEFQTLQPGDRVFNAQETRKILGGAAMGGKVPAFAKGYGGAKKYNTGSGSGSGSSDSGSSDSDYTEASTWRNELDWLYDLIEDIAEYERQQTIIQSKYELAVEDLSSTGRDLFKLTQKELVNLQTQLKAQETAYTKRLQQMGELQTMVNAEGYGRYVQWNQKDQTLEIDWDAIEAIQDKDTYDEVTDWIDRMEEVQDQLDDANETIWDIKQQIQELQDRYLEKYLDFQDRVMDAVVAQYQSTIDNFSELNDRVNDTNSAILDSIQKEIDLERQIRDNTDIEKNISDMEARLAYMQRDTTGANEGQIRALEKQLEDARESYSDTLVDQAVDRLSEANDAASAQREKQIELMQAQLDYWQESGGLWGEVANLIASGFASNGSIITGSDLWETLKKGETWDAMSAAQKKNWANELILETNEVGAHLIQISDGNTVNSAKVRASIADERGILTQNISAAAETVRAALPSLTGSMGGTPEHSYTAVKTDNDDSSSSSSSYTTDELNSFLSTLDDNFLQLADVMPAVSSGSVNTTNNYGNSPFNVNVNVGSIASDYDVDSMINRIKDELYSSASYRTGNVLSFMR